MHPLYQLALQSGWVGLDGKMVPTDAVALQIYQAAKARGYSASVVDQVFGLAEGSTNLWSDYAKLPRLTGVSSIAPVTVPASSPIAPAITPSSVTAPAPAPAVQVSVVRPPIPNAVPETVAAPYPQYPQSLTTTPPVAVEPAPQRQGMSTMMLALAAAAAAFFLLRR